MNNNEEYKYLESGFYNEIKEIIERSRKRIYRNIQNEMLFAYWQIGKMIVEKQGGDNRAKYGDRLIKELSIRMVEDFGKGFSERILRLFRQFYLLFPIWPSVRAELSWTHYKYLLNIEDKKTRDFYI